MIDPNNNNSKMMMMVNCNCIRVMSEVTTPHRAVQFRRAKYGSGRGDERWGQLGLGVWRWVGRSGCQGLLRLSWISRVSIQTPHWT